MKPVRLTTYTRFSGCGAKLGPGLLDKALCGLTQPAYPQLLGDYTTSEDCGIYAINDTEALIQTIDFFPPIVDDPFIFGRIAAANALSDIYAMGEDRLLLSVWSASRRMIWIFRTSERSPQEVWMR